MEFAKVNKWIYSVHFFYNLELPTKNVANNISADEFSQRHHNRIWGIASGVYTCAVLRFPISKSCRIYGVEL